MRRRLIRPSMVDTELGVPSMARPMARPVLRRCLCGMDGMSPSQSKVAGSISGQHGPTRTGQHGPTRSGQHGPTRRFVAALVIVLCLGVAASAQSGQNSPQNPAQNSNTDAKAGSTATQPDKTPPDKLPTGKMQADKAQPDKLPADKIQQGASKDAPLTPEEARRAQLVADTNKLYQMAQELQAEVAKSSKDTLSIAVIKKAEEVEKLAKSLKERMKEQ